MRKIYQKIDRIRSTGTATLNLKSNSINIKFNGKTFQVDSIGTPDHKCRVTLLIEDKLTHFTLCDIL